MGNLIDRSRKIDRNSSESQKPVRNTSRDKNSRKQPPIPSVKKTKIIRALYDYEPRQNDDLGFRKGDRMELLDTEGNGGDSDWLMARHLGSGEVGYVPSNYIVIDDNSKESQDWWFDTDRREAEKRLMLPGNPRGTFLIRHSTDSTTYVLSVRDFNQTSNEVTVRHYRIRIDETSGSVFITPKRSFPTVIQLVEHYKQNEDGLCHKLVKTCPKVPEPIPFKELEVDRSELYLLHKLGAGQFGEVFAGKWRRMVDVAVKTLKPNSMSANDFLEEAKTMHKLRHPKLVQLMGVCTKQEPMYIITELMINGSLLEYLQKEGGKKIALANLIDMAAQIADGLAYLEVKQYIHRDVRAANVLVGENNVVKVADFGLARLLTIDEPIYEGTKDTKFPIKWTAPEAAFKRIFSTKSDVWSFGVLLYEMVTYGKIPYPGMDNAATLEEVERGYRMPRPSECPMVIYDEMMKCWDKIPERRPTFERLHSFFDNYATESSPQYD